MRPRSLLVSLLISFLFAAPAAAWAKPPAHKRPRPHAQKGVGKRPLRATGKKVAPAPVPLSAPPAETLPGIAAPILLAPSVSDRPVLEGSGSETGKGALDFDLLGNAQENAAADAEASAKAKKIEDLGKARRTILTIHQAVGFATLAALIATEVVGQLNYNDLYAGGGGTRKYEKWHLGLSLTSTGLFATGGLLALFAPQPFQRRGTFDASVVHRIFMAIATLGFLSELGLGFYTASQNGKALQPALAGAHQIIGYTTLGAMSVGTVSLFF